VLRVEKIWQRAPLHPRHDAARRRELRSRTSWTSRSRTTLPRPIGQVFGRLGTGINSVGDRPRCRHDRRLRPPGGTFTFYDRRRRCEDRLEPRYFTFIRDRRLRSDCDRRRQAQDRRAANRSYDLVRCSTPSAPIRAHAFAPREARQLYSRSCAPTVCSPSTSRTTTSTSSRSSAASLGHSAALRSRRLRPSFGAGAQRPASRSTWVVVARNERALASLQATALGETRPEARPARLEGSVSNILQRREVVEP